MPTSKQAYQEDIKKVTLLTRKAISSWLEHETPGHVMKWSTTQAEPGPMWEEGLDPPLSLSAQVASHTLAEWNPTLNVMRGGALGGD